MSSEPTIADIAETQRHQNARRITGAMALLAALSLPVALGLRAEPQVVVLVVMTVPACALAYVLVRAGRHAAGVLLGIAAVLVEHVGVVVVTGELGSMPYLALVVVLIAAATVASRWLTLAFALALLTLVGEALLSPWTRIDQGAIVVAAFLTTLVYVVSLVHVRGTDHAFHLAETRDRARAQAALLAHESERRYRLIADHADDLIALLDGNAVALYLSPSHQRVLGWAVDELIGHPLDRWLVEQERGALTEAFAKTLTTGQAQVETTVPGSDGKPRVLDVRLKRVEAETGAWVALISRDITERRRIERRLQASERLEALGRLAGGVAHDFNNLLTVIGGSAGLAQSALPEEHPAREDIVAVLNATETATKLTRQLLAFSRKELFVPTRLDLAAALRERREILERMIGGDIVLELDLGADVRPVLMPCVYLEQLAMNLAVNARDAMPHGGRLVFSLRERSLADREVDELPAGTYVELAVSDEGTGVPEDILPHIFQPMFTTKGEAGTGLGLATCLSVATQLGGSITVETTTGKGSTFRVFLPGAAVATLEAPASEAESCAPVNRVLVLDDEEVVRETTARMLRSTGHKVWTASTLDEARRILGDPNIVLDAILTDVVLSGEKGTDLFEACRAQRPGARIVVMSGYAPAPEVSARLLGMGAKFLPKPFTLEQVVGILRGS